MELSLLQKKLLKEMHVTKPEELSEELPQKVDVITLALCEVDDYVPQLGRLYRFEMHEKCDACLRISTPNNIDAEGFEWPAYPREEVSAVGSFVRSSTAASST